MPADVRFALRTLGRVPAFTAIAVLSIALGIGANTAIFSLLDQVVLRPLPVSDPASLVFLKIPETLPGSTSSDYSDTVFSYPMYKDIRHRGQAVFEDLIGRTSTSVSLQYTGAAERGRAEIVTGNFFPMLGVRPALGRLLTADDDRAPGAHSVVVLSHSYWTRQFGASAAILNQTLRLNGHPMTIVGVTPPRFVGLIASQVPDVFVPVMMKKVVTPTWDGLSDRNFAWLSVFGRLRPGVTAERAEAALDPIFRPMMQDFLTARNYPKGRQHDRLLSMRLDVEPAANGLSNMRKRWTTPLKALSAMVGLVLLIACANVANLMITRAAGRTREMAIRASLGASRVALVRRLLVESLMLAFAGGALGVVFAYWAIDGLLRLLPVGSGPSVLAFYLDQRLLVFTFALCLITTVIFGLIPAWQTSKTDLASILKSQTASIASGFAHARVRRVMVVAQVALALVLLTGAGLFGRSLSNLLSIDPGFRYENLLTFSVNPRLSGYDHDRSVRFFRELELRLAAIPGVTAVAAASPGPFSNGGSSSNITLEGYRAQDGENMNASTQTASAGYFKAMGIPLTAGRDFNERDVAGAPKTAIVNEQFVRHFLKGASPLGRRFAFGAGDVKLETEIVGVVRDNKHSGLRDPATRTIFIPYPQSPSVSGMNVYVRAARDENSLVSHVRSAVAGLDGAMPVYAFSAMRVEVEESIYTEKLLAAVSAAFGLLATLLAAIGVYGVIAYNVARRTSEIGVRVALGAMRGDVLRLVMREVVWLAVGGVLLGSLAAIALGRWVQSELYGVKASDPLAFTIAAVAIGVAALLAAWIPARRATRIDPMQALRYE